MALGVPKEKGDQLGGCAVTGAHISSVFAGRFSEDALAEEEITTQVESFLREEGFSPENRVKCFQRLGTVALALPVHQE